MMGADLGLADLRWIKLVSRLKNSSGIERKMTKTLHLRTLKGDTMVKIDKIGLLFDSHIPDSPAGFCCKL